MGAKAQRLTFPNRRAQRGLAGAKHKLSAKKTANLFHGVYVVELRDGIHVRAFEGPVNFQQRDTWARVEYRERVTPLRVDKVDAGVDPRREADVA